MADAGLIPAATAANLIKVTTRHLSRLAKDGWIKKTDDDRFTLVGTVHGYIDYLKDENRRNSKQSATSKSQEARAREIEQRMAIRDRHLIDINEVLAFNDEVHASLRDLLLGLPAQYTRDLNERRKLKVEVEKICNAIADKIDKAAEVMRAGQPDLSDTGTDNSGSMGEG